MRQIWKGLVVNWCCWLGGISRFFIWVIVYWIIPSPTASIGLGRLFLFPKWLLGAIGGISIHRSHGLADLWMQISSGAWVLYLLCAHPLAHGSSPLLIWFVTLMMERRLPRLYCRWWQVFFQLLDTAVEMLIHALPNPKNHCHSHVTCLRLFGGRGEKLKENNYKSSYRTKNGLHHLKGGYPLIPHLPTLCRILMKKVSSGWHSTYTIG